MTNPTQPRPENATVTTTKRHLRTKTRNIGAAGATSPDPHPRPGRTPRPASRMAQRPLEPFGISARVLAAYWNEKREFGSSGSPPSRGSTTAS